MSRCSAKAKPPGSPLKFNSRAPMRPHIQQTRLHFPAISVAHVRYFCCELRTPVILLQCRREGRADLLVRSAIGFDLLARIEGKADDAEITIRISSHQELPASAPQLASAVAQAGMLLATRSLPRSHKSLEELRVSLPGRGSGWPTGQMAEHAECRREDPATASSIDTRRAG